MLSQIRVNCQDAIFIDDIINAEIYEFLSKVYEKMEKLLGLLVPLRLI